LLGVKCQSKRIDRILRGINRHKLVSLSLVYETSEGRKRVSDAYEMVVRLCMIDDGGSWKCRKCNFFKITKGGAPVSELALHLRHGIACCCFGAGDALKYLEALLLDVVASVPHLSEGKGISEHNQSSRTCPHSVELKAAQDSVIYT
jgi:hypothetical protein